MVFSELYPVPATRVYLGACRSQPNFLWRLRLHRGHHFWGDNFSIANGVVDLRRTAGPKQVTDLYLLALAAQRKGKFSSLDLAIPAKLVQGGAEAYEII